MCWGAQKSAPFFYNPRRQICAVNDRIFYFFPAIMQRTPQKGESLWNGLPQFETPFAI